MNILYKTVDSLLAVAVCCYWYHLFLSRYIRRKGINLVFQDGEFLAIPKRISGSLQKLIYQELQGPGKL